MGSGWPTRQVPSLAGQTLVLAAFLSSFMAEAALDHCVVKSLGGMFGVTKPLLA